MRYRILQGLLLLLCCRLGLAQSENDTTAPVAADTNEQLQLEITRLKEANQLRDTVIKNLIRRIEQLERAVPALPTKEDTYASSATEPPPSPEVTKRLQKESEENYKLVQKAFEQRLVQHSSMLVSPYHLIYEPSFSYAHASYDSIVVDGFTVYPVLVIGDIVSERVKRDILTNNHTFRLGLPWDTQLDLVIPLGYQRTRSFREDGSYESHEKEGIGDISLALRYQPFNGSESFPDTVVGLNWKSKTGEDPYKLENAELPVLGSGFETWEFSMTSMTVADPIVMFGGLTTAHTVGSEKNGLYIQPGDSFGINIGMALSLNFDTSLSFNYGLNYTRETEINGQKIHGSDLVHSTFGIGLSRSNNDFYATDIDIAIGLTRDATDFQITASFPFEFSLPETLDMPD